MLCIDAARINYDLLLESAPKGELADVRLYLAEELPNVWLNAYVAIMPHEHNVQRIEVDGFEYLWDLSSNLVSQDIVPASEAVGDRLVSAHGLSRQNVADRNDSRLKGRTLGPISVMDSSSCSTFDRGHAIGHALGGRLDLNILPQTRSVNRGGNWRRMERFCQLNPGTYFFCRPLYVGLSAHPAEIEFGILRSDGSLWVESFKNYKNMAELESIERLYRERIHSF